VNHANMGTTGGHRAFLAAGTRYSTSQPTAAAGRTKAGVGVNAEQNVGHGITVFGRAGFNNGHVESFAYTEWTARYCWADVDSAPWRGETGLVWHS